MNDEIRITGIKPGDEAAFCACLTPGDTGEDNGIKRRWFDGRTAENFGARLAKTKDGKAVGMIQYVPAEDSPVEGRKLWFVYCIWIPPKKRNPGRHMRGKGIGKALLKAAEEDVRSRGASGLAVWGTPLPFFMQSSWFRRQGYTACDKTGIQQLLWKQFQEGAQTPQWRRNPKPVPRPENDDAKADIVIFSQGICPAMNMTRTRFEQAARSFGSDASLRIVDVSDAQYIRDWGRTDAFFVNGKEISPGPPPSLAKITRIIKKEIRRK
ncbi:MAG: GNAT family N-acetyltransferase [Spirochaetales bacterium]|nr:GNAT family N-acetyltransferase [Spirochaetales bacterium]